MTRPVDEKIVKMSIDNQDFKTKANETIGVFGKLQDVLNKIPGVNLGKTTTDLGNIKTAANNIQMDRVADGVDKVADRFSLMGIVGMTVITNLTNKAVDAGIKIAKALTIDGVSAGFQEYELKMGATQTIMAGTKRSVEDVNKALFELNEYSDQTIYSFADMTQNIGKFTNAGVGLEDAVASIKGISNVAARSGADANEASRAMYNFSQGLSAGYIKLIDWQSIEKANMSTVEFKNQLLESGVAAGTLEKQANGMYKVLTENNKGGKMPETIDATKNFNESLSYQWMTSKALIGTLKEYADETTEIGKASMQAAQEVKTFTMLMDTSKEAVQSGWAQSSELIFGDFEEAKKRWTEVSGIISGIIGRNADTRNDALGLMKAAGVFEDVWDSVINILTAVADISKMASESFKAIFPTDVTFIKKITKAISDFTKGLIPTGTGAVKLKLMFDGMFKTLRTGIDIVVGIGKVFLNLIPDNLVSTIINLVKSLFRVKDAFKGPLEIGNKLKAFIEVLAVKSEALGDAMVPLVTLIGVKLAGAIQKLKGWISSIDFAAINDKFKGFLDKFSGLKLPDFKPALDKLKEFINKLPKVKMPDLTKFIEKLTSIKDFVMPTFKNPFSGDGLTNTIDKLSGALDTLKIAAGKVKDVLQLLWDKVKGLGSIFTKAKTSFDEFTGGIKKSADGVGLFEIAGIAGIGFAVVIFKKLVEVVSSIKKVLDAPDKLIASVQKLFGDIGNTLDAFQQKVKFENLRNIAISLALIAGSLALLSVLELDDIIKGLVALGIALTGMMVAMTMLDKLKFDKLSGAGMGVALLGIGTALLMVAGAVKKLSKIPTDQLVAGTIAVVAIMVAMTAVMKSLSKASSSSAKDQSEITKTIVAMGMISLVVGILVKSIVKLSKIPSDKILGSTLAVSALLVIMLAGFAAISAIPFKGLTNVESFVRFAGALGKSAVAIAIFSLSLKVLGEAVSFFGTLDFEVLKKGIGSIAILLITFGIMERIAGGKGTMTAGIGIAIIAASLSLLIPPLVMLGTMPYAILKQGLIALTIALLGLSTAMLIAKQGLSGGLGIAVLVGSIILLIPPLVAIGNLPIDILVKGMLGIAGALTVLVAAAKFATGSILGAAAIVILAAALNLLIPTILVLSGLNTDGLLSLLVGLGGAMLILATSIEYIGKRPGQIVVTAVGIALLATSLSLLVVPIAAIGNIPLAVIAVALGTLIGVLVILGGAATLLQGVIIPLLGLAAAITLFGAGIALAGVGLTLFASGLVVFGSAVGVAAAGFILSLGIILDGITELMPKIEVFVSALVLMAAQTIIKNAPLIVAAGVALLMSLVQGIVIALPQLIKAGVLILVGLMVGIGEGIPMLVQGAMDMMIKFISGMRIAVKEQGPYLVKEVIGLVGEIIVLVLQGIIAALDALIGWFPGVSAALTGLSKDVGTVIRENFDADTLGLPAGENITTGMAKGIVNGTSLVDQRISDMNDSTRIGLNKLDTKGIGTTQMSGFGEGLKSMIPGIGETGFDVSKILGDNMSIDGFGMGSMDMSQFDMGLQSGMPDISSTGFDMSELLGDSMTSFDTFGAGQEKTKVFGDGVDKEKQYVKMKAAGVSDATLAGYGLYPTKPAGEKKTVDYTEGLDSKSQYAIGAARNVSQKTLEAMGLFPATEEGKKKAIQFGTGLTDEEKYVKGRAEGLSKSVLEAMGLYPPTEKGKEKTKQLGEGLTSAEMFAVGAATKVSESTLAAMGLFPATEEGKKKTKALGNGISSENQYTIGIARGLSKEILAAMGLYPPTSAGEQKSKAVAKGIISEEGKVTSAASEVGNAAKAAFRKDTTSSGKHLDEGVGEGIDKYKYIPVSAARRMANATLDKMRKTFEEASPSKAGIRSGSFLSTGVAIGIKAKAELARKAAGDMARTSLRAMNGFIDQFAPSFEKDNELKVKLIPVMDIDSLAIVPDQTFTARASVQSPNLQVGEVHSALRQNGYKNREDQNANSIKAGDTIVNNAYEINLTANGDLPVSTIKRMANQIQAEIKNVSDRDKMSRGLMVNY